jgi:hypothetical protein
MIALVIGVLLAFAVGLLAPASAWIVWRNESLVPATG